MFGLQLFLAIIALIDKQMISNQGTQPTRSKRTLYYSLISTNQWLVLFICIVFSFVYGFFLPNLPNLHSFPSHWLERTLYCSTIRTGAVLLFYDVPGFLTFR